MRCDFGSEALNALQASVINEDSIEKNPQTNKAIVGSYLVS